MLCSLCPNCLLNITSLENFPPEKIALGPYLANKNVVIVGLPGAFTPTWSTKQIPDYVAKQDALRDKGVTEVIILAVNDGAVMMNWAKIQWVLLLDAYIYMVVWWLFVDMMCVCVCVCLLLYTNDDEWIMNYIFYWYKFLFAPPLFLFI